MAQQSTGEQLLLSARIAGANVEGVRDFVNKNKDKLLQAPIVALPLYAVLDAVEDEQDIDKLVEITKFLLKTGIRDKPGSPTSTLLYIAEEPASSELMRIAEVLLDDDDGQVFELYEGGKTVMKAAILSENAPLIEMMLKKSGLSIAEYPPNDKPIFTAIQAGNVEIVKMLLDAGVMVDIRNSKDETPLIYALKNATDEETVLGILKLLIPKTAVKSAKDNDGQTAYDYALTTPGITQEILDALKPVVSLLPPPKPSPGVSIAPPPPTSFMFQAAPATLPPLPPPAPKVSPSDYLPNAMELKGFEVRAFRSGPNIVPVYVTTLKKGTLLFRGVRDEAQLRNDVLGMNVLEDTEDGLPDKNPDLFCLSPHFNVYFYPFPFIDVTVGAFVNVAVYILKNDLKVACFISPSPLARSDRSIQGMAIQSCDKVPSGDLGCEDEGMVGRAYDPCFNHEFLEQHPDINGMIAIAGMDRDTFASMAVTPGTKLYEHYNHYYSAYVDSHSLVPGIPEIILHPRNKRITRTANVLGGDPKEEFESVNTFLESTTDLSEWLNKRENLESIPYVLFHLFRGRKDADIEKFMAELTSPDGWNGKHAQIDKTTGFYVVREAVEDASVLLPSEELGRMAESFPELIFTRARAFPSAPTRGSGRRTRRAK